jgi:Outer membrane protein beta-barrel domain
MRKFICFVLLISSISAFAQDQNYQIGIKIGPTYSNVRTKTEGANTSIERDGASINFMVGAFVDIPFRENYFFHTGINYTAKGTKVTIQDGTYLGGTPFSEEYNHESIQIPLLLKLYTNEILLDTKLFFNFGLVPEIVLNSSDDSPTNILIEEFNTFDFSGNFGGGMEYAIGVNTKLFASLNYYLGFLNQVKTQNTSFDEFSLKSNLLSLEFGIKF